MSDRTAAIFDFLFQAIEEGNVQEVQAILKGLGDIDIDERRKNGNTPLSVAIQLENTALVRVLLEKGADGSRRMHEATRTRNFDVVKQLLEFGGDVDDTDYARLTPLIRACRRGDLDMVKFLLDNGANVDHVSEYEQGIPMVVRWGLDYATEECDFRECEPFRFNTPLTEACRYRQFEVVKELVARGADLEVADPEGMAMTALMVASSCSTSEIYRLKNVDDQAKFHIMPTWPPILRHLIENGASVTTVNRFGETAVHCVLRDIMAVSRYKQKSPYVARTLQYYYINFCLLAKAGCPVLRSYEMDLDRSPHTEKKKQVRTLKKLSEAYAALYQDSGDTQLGEAYTNAIKSAVLSGVEPDKADLTMLSLETSPATGHQKETLDFLNRISTKGRTLRQLCQIRIRDIARRPLLSNILSSEFKLPVFLKQCILLERDVPTECWFVENSGVFDGNYPNYMYK